MLWFCWLFHPCSKLIRNRCESWSVHFDGWEAHTCSYINAYDAFQKHQMIILECKMQTICYIANNNLNINQNHRLLMSFTIKQLGTLIIATQQWFLITSVTATIH